MRRPLRLGSIIGPDETGVQRYGAKPVSCCRRPDFRCSFLRESQAGMV